MEKALPMMRATLETELARTRAVAVRGAGESRASDIDTLVENIISVVERTEAGERLVIETHIPENMYIPVATEDLTEILGALIENASRHARHLVCVQARMGEGESLIWVEDDGSGLGLGFEGLSCLAGGAALAGQALLSLFPL